jgi:hypothetical protein
MIHQDDPSSSGVKGMDNMAMLAQMALDSLDIEDA